MAVNPKAATAPNSPSAVATPRPLARPTTQPDASVRRIVSNAMGPIAAATAKPRMSSLDVQARVHLTPFRQGRRS